MSAVSSGIATHVASPLLRAIGIFADKEDSDVLQALEKHRDNEKIKEKVT